MRSRLADLTQMAFFAALMRPFLALFIGLRVQGRENLPREDPFVLVANHSSHLDTVSLLGMFPLRRLRYIRPVAAADYFERNRLTSVLSRTLFNILPIARKGFTAENDPIAVMRRALESGSSLIIFPEGTRGSSGDIGHFRSGIARVLEHVPGVPVVPAYLENMGRSLPKGEVIPLPLFCEIRIAPPRVLEGSREHMITSLEEAVRELKQS